jgi:hypothetical protein
MTPETFKLAPTDLFEWITLAALASSTRADYERGARAGKRVFIESETP